MAKNVKTRKGKKHAKKIHRKTSRKQHGGMGVLDTALVPFGILALQQFVAKRSNKSGKSGKSAKSAKSLKHTKKNKK